MLVRWLIFIHVLAAIAFFLFHGVSAAMAFGMRKETDFARIRALLDLSAAAVPIMGVSFLIMGLTGLILPFLVHIWDRLYIWLSIALMLGVFVYMAVFNERHYKELRRMVGLPYMRGNRSFPAEAPCPPEEVEAHIKGTNIVPLAIAGFGVPTVVLWLMI
ncbi:MAG: hypothetical protein ACM3MF_01300, partial [Anaerolineae bacterium]